MDLSVVILNWNTKDLLMQSLRSLECPQPGIDFEVVVVDNASEDDSREMVRSLFPQVRLITNPVNIGFGAGNNVAIPQTTGRYVLFLNSDTIVMEGALASLVQYADSRPEVAIAGPKLLNADGSLQYSCRRYPNLAHGFFRNTPLGRLLPKNRFAADYLMQDWDHAEPRDVDWVSGAALMIRRTLLDQIGGFDDEFYMYCEDVDLCWRANHAERQEQYPTPDTRSLPQWRVAYFPDAVIYHLIGKSSDLVPTRMTYEFHRSQYLFYKKHYAKTMPFWIRPLIPVGISLRAVGQLILYRFRYWKRRLKGQHKPFSQKSPPIQGETTDQQKEPHS